MHLFKKAIILLAIGTLLHLQVPHLGQADADPQKITENKPQFAGTAEEFLPGASSSSGKPFNKNLIWIAAGAAAVLAIAIGASGGGGGSDSEPDNQEPGGVSVEW
jgi:hypothetical protein